MTKDESELKTDFRSIHASGPIANMIVVLLIVLAFIFYQERRDAAEAKAFTSNNEIHKSLSDLRIDQCHSIQIEAVDALKRNSQANIALAESLGKWNDTLDRLDQKLNEQSKLIQQILISNQTRK